MEGVKFMCRLLKKLLATCFIGFGLGILLVILLPLSGWLFLIGCGLIIVGLIFLWQKNC
jgi:uncharacterized membrane protein YfcA